MEPFNPWTNEKWYSDFLKSKPRSLIKYINYISSYEQYLSKFRQQKINILEIGVNRGGSLQLWKHFFGENAKVYGIDIDPVCYFQEDQIKVFIGDQSDECFLKTVTNEIKTLDVVIDDGGHNTVHQFITLKALFPILNHGGIYLIEDTHTSYNKTDDEWNLINDSPVEIAKSIVDELTMKPVRYNFLSDQIKSITFANSLVIFEKTVENCRDLYGFNVPNDDN